MIVTLGSTSLNLTTVPMVACIGTCGAHARHTAVQDTWQKRIALSARKQMLTGAVGRQLTQYSSGTLTVEYQAWDPSPLFIRVLPFLDTALSTPLGLHGGMT